jgi:hypothetical protein
MNREICRYRGYEMVPRCELSHWFVSIHPTRPDLPLSAHSTLSTQAGSREDALIEAKERVDAILSSLNRLAL